MRIAFRGILRELAEHAPFTMVGALTGVGIMLAMFHSPMPEGSSETLFAVFHPLHVFLSALVTAGMYRLHSRGRWWATLLIGYVGSIGIATLSDCLIPYAGEWLLGLPHAEAHIGFIEHWWLVNPLALGGILLGYFRPRTKFPHAGHVLLSTWASLFHMTMALGTELDAPTAIFMGVFLFIAVWIPCCVSDIVFPLLFAKDGSPAASHHA